jgi:hypothetical protein
MAGPTQSPQTMETSPENSAALAPGQRKAASALRWTSSGPSAAASISWLKASSDGRAELPSRLSKARGTQCDRPIGSQVNVAVQTNGARVERLACVVIVRDFCVIHRSNGEQLLYGVLGEQIEAGLVGVGMFLGRPGQIGA